MYYYFPVSLILVGVLWGVTNPLIKKRSKGLKKVNADSTLMQFLLDVKMLATHIEYLVPIALNQVGSVLYFITLQNVDLTLSVPVANSLTFVFTAISGWILGEELPKTSTILGIVLVILGTILCCVDKYKN
ncbi:unnamed protein product [Phaedon cochleariae]|uniref:Transmembrane protein 234 homolog n=1 Tax=Phaedon cochleariae TaxID=80249 RepID=A0A9N9X5A7_PHACE|nr:unnamed protein product [Phaedon cochleariae]